VRSVSITIILCIIFTSCDCTRSTGCLIVALIYIERLRRTSNAHVLVSTWQPMLLISVIVAQKVGSSAQFA